MEEDKVEGINKIFHKYFMLQEQAYRDSLISNTIGENTIFLYLNLCFFLFLVEISTPLKRGLYTGSHTDCHIIVLVIIVIIVVCIVW